MAEEQLAVDWGLRPDSKWQEGESEPSERQRATAATFRLLREQLEERLAADELAAQAEPAGRQPE